MQKIILPTDSAQLCNSDLLHGTLSDSTARLHTSRPLPTGRRTFRLRLWKIFYFLSFHFNPSVPRGQKIKIRKLDLTGF